MISSILEKIGHGIATIGIAISSLFGFHQPVEAPVSVTAPQVQPVDENLGAAIPTVVAVFQSSLQASITPTATSMTLVSGTNSAGNALSGYTCFNIDEGTALEEFVCGTASGVNVTSMLRGLDPVNGSLEVTALKKNHRRGASVKITNYPSLGIVSRILNGNETIPNPISYASGVGPVSSSDLADKEYVLSVVSGGTITYNQVIVAGTAGETVAAGNLIYLKASDGLWYKTDADTASTVDVVQLGISQGSATVGVSISGGVLIKGVDQNNTGTAGALVYASNTAGALATSTGTTERVIGQYIVDSAGLYFDPSFYYTLTAIQKAALVGGSTFGTPSSSNKFITQDYLNSASVVRFGGTGADGALNVTSGTTTIDCTNQNVCLKNYSSINVSVGATLAFSNPASDGTIIILKSTGATTIAGTIDARGMGGDSTTSGYGLLGTETVAGGSSAGAIISSSKRFYTKSANQLYTRGVYLYAGSGGGAGTGGDAPDAAAGGAGGRGGGGVLIESRGSLTFSGTINASGSNGANGANGVNSSGGGGGGGGGSAGSIVVLYNTLTSNTGTLTTTGGTGGTGGNGSGGDCSGVCGGAGGAGSYTSAGGSPGGSPSSAGAGGGGGNGSPSGTGSAGAAGGASEGGLVAENKYLF